MSSIDSFQARGSLTVSTSSGERTYEIFRIGAVTGSDRLPFSHKVLLENLLRTEDGANVTAEAIAALGQWQPDAEPSTEIQFTPARVVMQDFTGVPAVVDLAAMRDAMGTIGGNPEKINPLSPVDLVIDHSVMVDHAGGADAAAKNTALEFTRNKERYEFLRWGAGAFDNFRVVPPGTGICHQVNLEFLSQTVWTRDEDGKTYAYPDSVVGTDSHTTMVNGLGVLGWGVGGIEAEAVMLGQPIYMLSPDVVGVRLTGSLNNGVTATDMTLRIVEMLREHGVVGKFVEFFGQGMAALSLADRATIANMAPEYGATCGFFPVDERTTEYLRLTGREEDALAGVEAFSKAQGLWYNADDAEKSYTDVLELDLGTILPALAGPKRPQDRVDLKNMKSHFIETLTNEVGHQGHGLEATELNNGAIFEQDGEMYDLNHGDVVIAAITSCTNTSNPDVMLAAGRS